MAEQMYSMMIRDKCVRVFPAETAHCPVIYLHTHDSEGAAVWQAVKNMGARDFNLVAVSGLRWNDEMSPWVSAPIRKNDAPFGGEADVYLEVLLKDIMPQAERLLWGKPCWRGLCGYSLAGLFSVYALYKSAAFSRMASVSGSLWYPKVQAFVESRPLCVQPERLYFSLGDKECRTRNPQLREVQTATENLVAHFRQQGIAVTFVLHPGNHFQDTTMRTAQAVQALLADAV